MPLKTVILNNVIVNKCILVRRGGMAKENIVQFWRISKIIRELTENIPNWVYYPQLGISNPQLGIIYPIGDWGLTSQVRQNQRTNPQLENIHNWGNKISN